MKKVLFIDRDGTIIKEPPDEQVDSFEKFVFIPRAITGLSRIALETDFELVMVTNQDGLGTSSFPEEKFWPVQNKMLEILKGEGIEFKEIFIDKTFPQDNVPSRKPGVAMLVRYLSTGVDLNNSYVIGDRESDMQLAENLGCRSIYFNEKKSDSAVLSTNDWVEISDFLKSKPRKAELTRKTKETDITVEINLDGTGKSSVSTGIGFLDHMLDQIARHSYFDITIKAQGDRFVDNHHLVEDLAIVMGDVFRLALGSKKGIQRYSFVLPMDDCLAQVAVDLGGRPWLVWDVEFNSPMIGEMPSEMFCHFFKSFSDNAKCTINIKAEGNNDHHKIESVFKAMARTLGAASRLTENKSVPSTKGKL